MEIKEVMADSGYVNLTEVKRTRIKPKDKKEESK